MAVSEQISAYSTVASSNTPAGTDTVGPDLDNHLTDSKKNIRISAEHYIRTPTDGNFAGAIKASTSGNTHTLSYQDGGGGIELFEMDASADTSFPYVGSRRITALGASIVDKTATASALVAMGLASDLGDISAVGTVGGAVVAETNTASAQTTIGMRAFSRGIAAEDTTASGHLVLGVGTSIGDLVELVTGSGTSAASLPAVDGSKLKGVTFPQPDFTSSEQTLTDNSTNSVATGLSATASHVFAFLRCKTTNLGYAVGDTVPLETSNSDGVDAGTYFALQSNNVLVIHGSPAIRIIDRSTHQMATGTNANWRVVVRAWR